MKVSIAMAAYNGEKYIKEQLDSFSAQTRLPDELIITDDCSTDSTEEIVKEFAETAPFTVVFHRNEKNLGYCGNFNAALMKTTGDLVFLSDQDDVWFPEKIEFMVRLADENPDMLALMNDTVLTDSDLNSVGLTKLGQFKTAGISLESYVMGCCCAIRRELLYICMPIPEGFKAHDNWIVNFADGLNAKLVTYKSLQYYRRHDSNESQFIANRTVKVGKLDVFISRFQYLFSDDRERIEINKLAQMMIFSEGLRRAAYRASRFKARIELLLQSSELKVELYRERSQIRAQSLFARLLSSVKFLARGWYKVAGGFKGFVKDVVG